MIKFDTINGTLCRMVEPTPLTPEATFPCVGRLIQDDSPMGLCNRWKYSEKQDFLKKDWTISSLENNLNKVKDIHYSQFEIIGYPVADGSAEWALWQMKQGKKVYHKYYTMKTTHCAINDESQVVIFTTPYSVANGGDVVCHANEWLDHRQYGCGVDERTGWQLYEPTKEAIADCDNCKNKCSKQSSGIDHCVDYEPKPEPEPKPKPLLADAKVGWICRHRNGAYSQIGGIDYPCPVTDCISIGKNRYDRDGKHSGEDMRLNPNPDLDIIHAEPLAAEGSAEWAWQMAKLGIETKCSRGKIRISKSGMIEVCYNGMAYAMPMTQSPENRQYVINKMRECSPDGWQLYEPKPETEPKPEHPAINGYNRYDYIPVEGIRQPKPEPAKEQFKVGDWVEYSDGTLQQAIIEAYSGQPGEQMVYVWHPQTAHSAKTPLQSITRKLDPSEVVVKIGCLSGTIKQSSDPAAFILMPICKDGGLVVPSIIAKDMLDAPTRELVESLLKAQEEE